ncbi:hypothetical protein [Flaviflagellibacter deserti]|uniref:Uncharacterized protein n=1 Tax=Flaviflagellibacter deserti TaxID=2267266 RepID=A0ABV9Z4Y0_9HYPH
MLISRRAFAVSTAMFAILELGSQAAMAADSKVSLFRIVTVKDEIVVGFTSGEINGVETPDASVVGRQLVDRGELSVWQYTVRKNEKGELEQAPLKKISVLKSNSLRVEPYFTPLPVIAPK